MASKTPTKAVSKTAPKKEAKTHEKASAKAPVEPKELVREAIKTFEPELRALAKELFSNPEIAFAEKNALILQKALLEKMGAKIVAPFANIETAYKASWGNTGDTFVFIAEYDALPEMGHACGHNLIATNAIAAAYATKCYLEKAKMPGTVVVMGTPAEEGKGGKILMIRERAFFRCDAAIVAHPADRTHSDNGMLSNRRFTVIFHGIPSHASTSPEFGRNALDGANILFAGVNAWRQHLPETARVHGIITEGGVIPNIVPDLASCRFYLRADTDNATKEMEKRFKDIVKGAALISGTKYRIQDEDTSYRPTRINDPLNHAYCEEVIKLGFKVVNRGLDGRGSSDFGNLSQVLPGAHVAYQICEEGTPWHTLEFKSAVDTEHAINQTLKVAEAIAHVGIRFFNDEDFRKEMKVHFDENASQG